jgi:alkylation response protein AidB-like acyl-CoA dehydrogenase
MSDPIRLLLRLTPPAVETLTEWRRATIADREAGETPVDRALLGGACADRLGFAFAGGYGEALRALVPGLDGIAALCITEAGGNTPRAIETALVRTEPGAYELTGHKKWATVGSLASSLLVAASVGRDGDRNHIRMVRVPARAPGVRIVETSAPFVPEIPHAEITFQRVAVRETDLLTGDGYTEYIKPFRTVEDIHVHAALLGYLIGVARRKSFGTELVERLLALATTTRAAAAADARSPSTHVVLAGLFALVAREVAALEALWSATPDAEWQRWQRDRALLQVAGKARAARRETAWSLLDTP